MDGSCACVLAIHIEPDDCFYAPNTRPSFEISEHALCPLWVRSGHCTFRPFTKHARVPNGGMSTQHARTTADLIRLAAR